MYLKKLLQKKKKIAKFVFDLKKKKKKNRNIRFSPGL